MDFELNKIKNILQRSRASILDARRLISLIPRKYLNKLVKLVNLDGSGYIGRYRYVVYVDIPTGIRKILYITDWEYNLVTNAGRFLFLNRIGSNSVNFINAIAIGTGTNHPKLDNTILQTETVRKNATVTVNGSPDWKSVFTASFNSNEVNGTTEIGLLNSQTTGGTLATRNVHGAISVPEGSSISFNYEVLLQSGETSTGYTLTTGKTYTFEKSVQDDVRFVVELDTGNGYAKKTSTTLVESTPGSYYYDSVNKKLYLHTIDGTDPDTHQIVVYSGG